MAGGQGVRFATCQYFLSTLTLPLGPQWEMSGKLRYESILTKLQY